MASASSSSSSQSCNWEVFLSFRGEDTRKTFVDHLYSALADRKIHTYKDDETLPRGESIGPSLFKAIEESQIAIIVFSQNYADSWWCLEELAYIMKCKDKRGLTVMPVFYDVDPSDVRKQKGKFGEAFSKQEAGNMSKVESWRKALVSASEIAGWEPKNIANGHESKVIKEIVETISNNLFYVNSYADEDLIGMSVRWQELEAQLDIGSGGVRMVGVWGIGGSGKTTLASSLYMKISHRFQGHCIIDNIREESSKHGLKTMQENLLSRLLKTEMKLQSVEEGKHMIKIRLNRSNVLILLDDVDDCRQLDALVGSHKWFGSGSRIVITTRDEHVLITHRVNHVCSVTLLSREEAIMLFNKHACNKNNLVNDYEKLSLRVVSYSNGLPLALKVLGSFLYDKDEKEWVSCLARLKDIPEMKILEKLKISYDGLKIVEKELFLDIACFFRGESTERRNLNYFDACRSDYAMDVFEACGYHPHIGIKVLTQKALVNIVGGRFNMHDLVQEMGHYIVRGEHPNNPYGHSRVWKHKEIRKMYLGDATMENNKIEAIQFRHYSNDDGHLSPLIKIVSNMKKLRWLSLTLDNGENVKGPNLLSNELQYFRWYNYPISPFPDSFKPVKLATLILCQSLQKQLWKGYKHLPSLKVLVLSCMDNLLNTPNFDGLPCLQRLKIDDCQELQEIHPSLGKHTSLEYVKVFLCERLRMFPTIIQMGKLKRLEISNCHESLEFPKIQSKMESLVKLFLGNMWIDVLLSSIGDQCPNLNSLGFNECSYLKNKESNFYGFINLEAVRLRNLYSVEISSLVRSQLSNFQLVLPQFTHSLQNLSLYECHLKDGEIPSNIGELFNLQVLDLNSNDFTRLNFSLLQLTQLKVLRLSFCNWLVEFPKLPSGVAVLNADYCDSLTTFGDFYTNCKWLCEVTLMGRGVVTDCCRLLQSMLEGSAIEKHCMILELEGFEIAKGFRTPLVRARRCRLKLPENWSNDFSGFLMCFVGTYYNPLISMEQVLSGMDLEDDVVWEESNDDKTTRVWYVSFASIRDTAWWDSTYKELLFSFQKISGSFGGCGVSLVAKNTTTQEEPEISNFTHELSVKDDSAKALKFQLFRKPVLLWR